MSKSPAITQTEQARKEAWLDESVEVEFLNVEEPGLMQQFTFGTTKNRKTYKLFHGGKYTLPRRVIQHLESRQTPIWKYRPDGRGSQQKELISWKPRFQCRQTFSG